MRPSAYAYAILSLCVLVGMAEGYDAQAMAFAAPLVAEAWHIPPGALGGLLATSILGMVVGGFTLAPLGDRWGRRPAILAALLIVGLATSAGAYAPDIKWLLASRFIAGLGLGLAFPTLIALAMEIMPRRLQTLAVVLVGCGYPLGGAIGGAISAGLIPQYGYPVVFLLGGGVTLALLIGCALLLPESPMFLASRGGRSDRVRNLVKRLGARLPEEQLDLRVRDKSAGRSPVSELFTAERKQSTLLLWLLNFSNLLVVYYFVTWLPTIIVAGGRDAAFAATGLAAFSAAGIVGGLGLAFLLMRFGPFVTLGWAYLAMGIAGAALATFTEYDGRFLATLMFAGIFTVGSQFSLNAVVNRYYPTAIRATASGFASGAGRLGAVAAPLIGGAVMSMTASPQIVLAVTVAPATIALLALVALRFTPGFIARHDQLEPA